MSINLTVVALYVVNAYVRKRSHGTSDAVDPSPAAAETGEHRYTAR
ncbi:MAG TPA: hypothetical protein VL199_17355 [Burkholderiales bacterium]|jgi:hypothetical protein|nr:hypothetical protein [Burkholderiales bacterium]